MSISVPATLIEQLAYDLDYYTGLGLTYAKQIARSVASVAIYTAQSAVGDAREYTNAAEKDVRRDLTESLNYASNYLSDDIHILRQYVIEKMIPALEGVADTSGGVSDEIGENIVKAYDAIGVNYVTLGEVVKLAIAKAAEWVTGAQEQAKTFINDGVMAAIAVVGDTVVEITSAVDKYTEFALESLIPAEARALFQTVGDILAGDPVRMLFDYGGRVFKAQLGEVLTIDDEELESWIKKGSEYMQGIAMQAAKPGGAI